MDIGPSPTSVVHKMCVPPTVHYPRAIREYHDYKLVQRMRKAGRTWREIGEYFGVTHQSVWEKYHKRGGIK